LPSCYPADTPVDNLPDGQITRAGLVGIELWRGGAAELPAGGVVWLNKYRSQDSFALSRNGFQESASLLASLKCPSSKNLPTHLKYSQRNDASGNW
jgi:hypothetical protein